MNCCLITTLEDLRLLKPIIYIGCRGLNPIYLIYSVQSVIATLIWIMLIVQKIHLHFRGAKSTLSEWKKSKYANLIDSIIMCSAFTFYIVWYTAIECGDHNVLNNCWDHNAPHDAEIIMHPWQMITEIIMHPTIAEIIMHPWPMITEIIMHPTIVEIIMHPRTAAIIMHPANFTVPIPQYITMYPYLLIIT